MPKSNRSAPWMVTGGRGVGSSLAFPAGRVHAWIPNQGTLDTDSLVDTINVDNLPLVNTDPTLFTLNGIDHLQTGGSNYYASTSALSRITDEYTIMFIGTTDVTDTTARTLRHSIGLIQLGLVLNRFAGFVQFNINNGAVTSATYQRSIMPDNATPIDCVAVIANSGYTKYINGISSGVGSSGPEDLTGTIANNAYFGRDNPGATTGRGRFGPLYVWNRVLTPTEVETARRSAGMPAAA